LIWFAIFISTTKPNETTIINSNSANQTHSDQTLPGKENLPCTPTFVSSPLQIIKIAYFFQSCTLYAVRVSRPFDRLEGHIDNEHLFLWSEAQRWCM